MQREPVPTSIRCAPARDRWRRRGHDRAAGAGRRAGRRPPTARPPPVIEPSTAAPHGRGREGRRRGRDAGRRRRRSRRSRRARGRDCPPGSAAGVLTKASFLIRERQEQLADARGAQRRQAHLGGARRDRHRGQRLRVLGRGREQDHGRDDPDRAARARRHAARAGRRVRPHHPVELPGGHRELEDRAGARVRQHRGREAGLADPAHRPRDRRHPLRGRASRGHPERAARAPVPRRRARSSPTRASRRSRSRARPRWARP